MPSCESVVLTINVEPAVAKPAPHIVGAATMAIVVVGRALPGLCCLLLCLFLWLWGAILLLVWALRELHSVVALWAHVRGRRSRVRSWPLRSGCLCGRRWTGHILWQAEAYMEPEMWKWMCTSSDHLRRSSLRCCRRYWII